VGYVLQLKGVLADCPRDTVAILVGNRFSVWAHLWARLSRFDIILTTRGDIIEDLARYQPRRRRRSNTCWVVLWEILKLLMLSYICFKVYNK